MRAGQSGRRAPTRRLEGAAQRRSLPDCSRSWRCSWCDVTAGGRSVVPVSLDIVAEGRSLTPGVGRFRGRVHAMSGDYSLSGRHRRTKYLISDPKEVRAVLGQARRDRESHGASRPRGRRQARGTAQAWGRSGTPSVVEHVRRHPRAGGAGRADPGLPAGAGSSCRTCGTSRTIASGASSGLASRRARRLSDGDGSCLVVTDPGRLGRSASGLGEALQWLKVAGPRLSIEPEIDTATDAGRATTSALITIGEREWALLSERGRKRLAAAREKRPVSLPDRSRPAGPQAAAHGVARLGDDHAPSTSSTARRADAPWGAKRRRSSVQAAAGYARPTRVSRLKAPAEEGSRELTTCRLKRSLARPNLGVYATPWVRYARFAARALAAAGGWFHDEAA